MYISKITVIEYIISIISCETYTRLIMKKAENGKTNKLF